MAGRAGGGNGGGRGGGGDGEDVYATLLLTDTYLPGALVLAHSLRDAGTTKKLAALVTLDTVSSPAVSELKTVYDYIIPVPRIRNSYPANLELMNRTDLHSAFTKINLWKQTQFRKIVYLDADVLAYRAPDELFSIEHPFSAAPDIGWPDLFNTGVMVLTPNVGEYYAMMAMAERGISFDGADQGLLNMHFRNNFNRISFTYNVTPSAHYQYVPAYRHFQSSINMVHFIGSNKPWMSGRYASLGNSPFDEMTGRWWAVYDRHYRVPTPVPAPSASAGPTPEHVSATIPGPGTTAAATTTAAAEGTAAAITAAAAAAAPTTTGSHLELVQYFTKGEYQPRPGQAYNESTNSSKPYEELPYGHHVANQFHAPEHHYQTPHQHDGYSYTHDSVASAPSAVSQVYHDSVASDPLAVSNVHHDHHHDHHHDGHGQSQGSSWFEDKPQSHEHPNFVSSDAVLSSSNAGDTLTEVREEQSQIQEAPAVKSEPEQKPEPFQPAMSTWDAQWHPPPSESKPEAMNFPATIYEMSNNPQPFVPPQRYPSPPKDMWYEVPKEARTVDKEPLKPIFPWETNRPKPSRVFVENVTRETSSPEVTGPGAASGEPWPLRDADPLAESTALETSTTEGKSEPVAPQTPTIRVTPAADLWATYTMTNAWDELPEINRYVDSMQQKHRRTRSLKAPGVIDLSGVGAGVGADEVTYRRRGSKLTDFPTEDERPSLPVTPAPVRRGNFWGGGASGSSKGPVLPAAADVPGQSEWVCSHGNRWTFADCLCDLANVLRVHKDPVAQLEKLAKQQSEEILQRLSGSASGRDSSELPPRPLPFGSESLVSPTYVAQTPKLVSPRPLKVGLAHRSAVLSREFAEDAEATPRASPQLQSQSPASVSASVSAVKTVTVGRVGSAAKRWVPPGIEEAVLSPAPGPQRWLPPGIEETVSSPAPKAPRWLPPGIEETVSSSAAPGTAS